MNGIIQLERRYFNESEYAFFKNDEFTVNLFSYSSGIEAVEIHNSRGRMVVLPYFGQMIWDLEFDGMDLKMQNMFSEPKKSHDIIGTYGCFAFHSGLVRNGCPAPEDDHPLHGEMPCAAMDRAWLEVTENSVKVCGSYEYVMGFGHHYCASPSVEMHASDTYITMKMDVENLSRSQMPLQYMCHTNYAYIENASFTQSVPSNLFSLRESIPAHVKPTENWLQYNDDIRSGKQVLETLSTPELYDPEIVFFADELDEYGKEAEFQMTSPDGTTFFTKFCTKEMNYATRWILNNPDQKVAAFVLPATCRPEGYRAAEKAGTLITLAGGEKKSFTVITGKK